MSYDITIHVKVEGMDKYPIIARPDNDSPTYNLGKLFRECMSWDFSQSEPDENGVYHTCFYKCDYAIDRVNKGLHELYTSPNKYKHLLPSNGWGTMSNAIDTLESLRKCIYEEAEEIPLDHLYMSW